MNNEEKLKSFEKEIGYIHDKSIRLYVMEALQQVPDYFWEVAASSTGKYHPAYSLGDGGLYRHTRSAVRIAVELLNNETFSKFTDEEKDLAIASLILHDTYKHGGGTTKTEFTIADHPDVAVMALSQNNILNEILDENKKTVLFGNIAHHMGEWNYHPKTKEVILGKPKGQLEKFVHMCDYLASRKMLQMDFDVEVIRK